MSTIQANLNAGNDANPSCLGKISRAAKRRLHSFVARPVNASLLPKTIHMFADVIGMQEAIKIASFITLHGQRVSLYFPSGDRTNHVLQGVISEDAFQKLCHTFKHEIIDISPCKRWSKGLVKQRIANLYRQQFTPKEIAKILNIGLMTVYRELNKKTTQAA